MSNSLFYLKKWEIKARNVKSGRKSRLKNLAPFKMTMISAKSRFYMRTYSVVVVVVFFLWMVKAFHYPKNCIIGWNVKIVIKFICDVKFWLYFWSCKGKLPKRLALTLLEKPSNQSAVCYKQQTVLSIGLTAHKPARRMLGEYSNSLLTLPAPPARDLNLFPQHPKWVITSPDW